MYSKIRTFIGIDSASQAMCRPESNTLRINYLAYTPCCFLGYFDICGLVDQFPYSFITTYSHPYLIYWANCSYNVWKRRWRVASFETFAVSVSVDSNWEQCCVGKAKIHIYPDAYSPVCDNVKSKHPFLDLKVQLTMSQHISVPLRHKSAI